MYSNKLIAECSGAHGVGHISAGMIVFTLIRCSGLLDKVVKLIAILAITSLSRNKGLEHVSKNEIRPDRLKALHNVVYAIVQN